MGRWSHPLAEHFVRWLGAQAALDWLDVGCGTGALTSAILGLAEPASVVACDPSGAFVQHTRRRIADPKVSVVVGGAGHLPQHPDGFDRVVSGLVINFLGDPRRAIGEMRASARTGGVVAGYVWDYAGRMEFLRVFWDEAVALDPSARSLDEGVRFPMCERAALESIFRDAGVRDVRSGALEIPTRFESFSDYWQPFLAGVGPAPVYAMSLSEGSRAELRSRLERRCAVGPGGTIDLVARAWAVRGTVP